MRLDKSEGPAHFQSMTTDATHMTGTAEQMTNLADRLRQHGMRPTRQRVRLASLLLESGDQHISPDKLYEQINQGGEPIAIGTVYNTLRQFCEAGLIREVQGAGDRFVYDTNLRDHHHFMDVETGELIDIDEQTISLDTLPAVPDGFTLEAVDVTIRIRKTGK